jgi:hypothetical protein
MREALVLEDLLRPLACDDACLGGGWAKTTEDLKPQAPTTLPTNTLPTPCTLASHPCRGGNPTAGTRGTQSLTNIKTAGNTQPYIRVRAHWRQGGRRDRA